MRLGVVGHLVAHAGQQGEATAVFQLGVQLALQAQQHVAFAAPVVGQVARRVFHHANADGAELAGAPVGDAGLSGMGCGLDGRSVGDAEGNVVDVHGALVRMILPATYLWRQAAGSYRSLRNPPYIGHAASDQNVILTPACTLRPAAGTSSRRIELA